MFPQVYILLGRQGCGKGTQAKLLIEKFNLAYVGSGELLRDRIKKEDFNGKKAQEVMNRGILVPTFLIFQQWANRLEEIKKRQNENFSGLVFDGSPRKLKEAEMLMEALDWYEWSDVKALLIDISRQEAFSRLTKRRICKECGQLIPYVGHYKTLEKCDKCNGELETRADDTPDAINQRLDLFDEEVVPVIKFFEKQGKLVKINGEQPIDDVFDEILGKIK